MGLFTREQAQRNRELSLNQNDAFLSAHFWNLLAEISRKMETRKFRSFMAHQEQERMHEMADQILDDINFSVQQLKRYLGVELHHDLGTDSYRVEKFESARKRLFNEDDGTSSLRKSRKP